MNCVDAAVHLSLGVQPVEQRDYPLLVGDRDIVAVKLPESCGVFRFKSLRSDIKSSVFCVDPRKREQTLVNKRRHCVTYRMTDYGIFFCFQSHTPCFLSPKASKFKIFLKIFKIRIDKEANNQ